MASGELTTDQREFLGSRYGILRGERPTWTVEKPAGFQPVTRSGAFWAVGGDRLCGALDALFGAGRWARPWLRGLREPGHGGDRIQRYIHDGTVVDGVPLRVVELAGEPGDVVVMHSDCFHAAAPNRLAEPRMMLTGMIESSL